MKGLNENTENSKSISRLQTILKSNNYMFCSDGRVWSYKSKRWLSGNKLSTGYIMMDLCNLRISLHRIMALLFIPNLKDRSVVNHLDSNPLNNDVKNLEWCTQGENLKHAFKVGRKSHFGEDHPSNKLTESQVILIKEFIRDGYNNKYISEMFLVGRSTIQDIRKDRTWRNVHI